MKFIISLTVLITLPTIADSYNTGSSDKIEKFENSVDQTSYFLGATDVKDQVREIASKNSEKNELSMGEDAYFTGSSY